MCLILFAWKAHPDYTLVVAANRDEFHNRPTEPAHIWPDIQPTLIAGRDLQAGGTWMGITDNGRFAAVTNYREVPSADSELSRGELVTDYLNGDQSAQDYAQLLHSKGQRYAGFNLLIGDDSQLLHISNRSQSITDIKPGIHGLSNATLNTPWPKVQIGKSRLQQLLLSPPNHADLQALLSNQQTAADNELPSTGINLEMERMLSASKIISPSYGTRSSTSLLLGNNRHIDFYEQSYDTQGKPVSKAHIQK